MLVAVLAIYWRTTLSTVDVWSNSTTYSHGFLIVPVFLWLVWKRRFALSQLPIRPSWLGLPGLAAMGLVWLIGDFAAAAQPGQFAVVAMVPLAVATVLGVRWVRALAFPFAFLFFAVPFGDSLVLPMMNWTADFIVVALRLSGVPVYHEGNHFSIPSGDWSVIEACSGIRYVFACFTVSTLYAWIVYRGTARRLMFIGGALAIVVVANWIRAYAIVMLANLSSNGLATGIDHLIFGGVFFGVVMAIIFGLGTVWREDQSSDPAMGASVPAPTRTIEAAPWSSMPGRSLAAALVVAAILVVWPLVSIGTAHESYRVSGKLGDITPLAGWARAEEPVTSWRPELHNPSQVRLQTFVKNGHRVSVYVGVFDHPSPEAKVVSSANRLVGSENPRWKQIERGVAEAHRQGEVVSVRTGTLFGRDGQVLAWHWYWVDGTMTTSPARAALAQVIARLRGRSEMSAWVTVYTAEGDDPTSGPRVLDAFVSEMLGSIEGALQAGNSSDVQKSAPGGGAGLVSGIGAAEGWLWAPLVGKVTQPCFTPAEFALFRMHQAGK
ncbi:MAG: exosortase A [Caldimonas sp.]